MQSELSVPSIYLDNNATTPAHPLVVAAMLPFFSEQFGNASSGHAFGMEVAPALTQARRNVQALIGAAFDHEIVFTSGATESDNTAILSALAVQEGRDEIVTTAVEHSAVLSLAEELGRRGIKIHVIPVDASGRLDIESYGNVLSERTSVASIMWANNETGTIFPVKSLAKMARSVGALFHTDAVQAVGRIPIDLKTTDIDMLSLSGHKLHGPKGVGALYVRKDIKFRPLIFGGLQERRRRAGTENVSGIVGLGKAAELAAAHLIQDQIQICPLRDRLERGILALGGCIVLGDIKNRLPNTSNIAFEHLEAEAIVHHLNRDGIATSLGSACACGSMEPSHVLRAMRVAPAFLRGAVRFSLSRETAPHEIDRVLQVLAHITSKQRALWRACQERAGESSQPAEPL
ncbi:cysteine desulfurase NifS [Bradyrhizobium sp. LLZ17]|uniref:Cysteine desulfurase n=1 Tax=Bradyrhizobium sp. LLZ17 TaxID=3239388 RepID=A0AB39XWC8_9BRAD